MNDSLDDVPDRIREDRVFVVLGNQLFPRHALAPHQGCRFYLAEDAGLCTYVRHHKQKIVLFLAAMRAYAADLQSHGFAVHYERLDATPARPEPSYEDKLAGYLDSHPAGGLVMWEIEDRFFEERIQEFAKARGLDLEFLPSPMFLTSRELFAEFADSRPLRMASFYAMQRARLDVMMDGDQPRGGQWSFDQDNRKKIPKDLEIVQTSFSPGDSFVEEVAPMVQERFSAHPGELDTARWWMPTTRRQALAWLRAFLSDRFADFGPYEDALTTRQQDGTLFLWHSALSPMMNLGLITPDEVVERALEAADAHDVPINSLEGFIRQVIGWREFIRGVYRQHGEVQEQQNFFGHGRKLADCWWDGTTGLPPLDDMIRRLLSHGWAHHIERLMVAGNLMLLCGIEPREAHRWFMEMFVDSSDWVMGPNVYGMALFSDGGLFATKPYISGSNYIFKMSDYDKPKKSDAPPPFLQDQPSLTWADAWDGLYWRFVQRHREFFAGQPRLSRITGTLDRMSEARGTRIFAAADAFLAHATRD